MPLFPFPFLDLVRRGGPSVGDSGRFSLSLLTKGSSTGTGGMAASSSWVGVLPGVLVGSLGSFLAMLAVVGCKGPLSDDFLDTTVPGASCFDEGFDVLLQSCVGGASIDRRVVWARRLLRRCANVGPGHALRFISICLSSIFGTGGGKSSFCGLIFRSEGRDGKAPGMKGLGRTCVGTSGTGGAFAMDDTSSRRALSSLFSRSLTFLLSLFCFAMSFFEGSRRRPVVDGGLRVCDGAGMLGSSGGIGGVSVLLLAGERWICDLTFFRL